MKSKFSNMVIFKSSGFCLTVEIFSQMVFIYSVLLFRSNDPLSYSLEKKTS